MFEQDRLKRSCKRDPFEWLFHMLLALILDRAGLISRRSVRGIRHNHSYRIQVEGFAGGCLTLGVASWSDDDRASSACSEGLV